MAHVNNIFYLLVVIGLISLLLFALAKLTDE